MEDMDRGKGRYGKGGREDMDRGRRNYGLLIMEKERKEREGGW